MVSLLIICGEAASNYYFCVVDAACVISIYIGVLIDTVLRLNYNGRGCGK